MRTLAVVVLACAMVSMDAHAQALDLATIVPKPEGPTAGRMVQLLALLTVLSLAPGLLIMVTCFTRIIVALSFLRAGLGLQGTPANIILISLALFMTAFVMAPAFDRAWTEGVAPLMENKIDEKQAFEKVARPFRDFMLTHVRPKDLRLFQEMSKTTTAAPATAEVELRVLIPAFMISELRRGFEIGFLIVLPFLVIDIIVATVTMSMGMMMLSPVVISLPVKVLFFILIDGWHLLIGSLVRSFG